MIITSYVNPYIMGSWGVVQVEKARRREGGKGTEEGGGGGA